MIGLGSLGASIAELLTRAGVTQLTCIDGNALEMGNLCRHTLCMTDLYQSKSKLVAKRLTNIDPNIHTTYAEPGISGICHTARRYFPEGEDHSRQDRLNDPVSCGRIYRHAAVLRLQPVPASGGFAGSGGIRHGLHHVVLL